MADKTTPVRKKPVSQKRVAVVLASLVGTMTISAGALLLMEGGALGTSVPGAFAPQLVAPPLQAKTWKYIIVYESADASASAEMLIDGRLTGGSDPSSVRPKANFHFSIDKGGAYLSGTSWQRQEPGAPYATWPLHSSYSFTPYTNAIGICLAADGRAKLPATQYQALLQIVRDLQRLYDIPRENVLFHWDPRLGAHRAGPATPAQLQLDAQLRAELN